MALLKNSWPPVTAPPGSAFYPPSGGASRAFGLPRAAAKRFFASRGPHPLCRPAAGAQRGKMGSISGSRPPRIRSCCAIQRKGIFLWCCNFSVLPSLFAPVGHYVPRWREGQGPAPPGGSPRIWAAVSPPSGAPGEAQRSGFAGERRSSGMSEFSPLWGGNEGYGACDDDKRDKGRGRRCHLRRSLRPTVRVVTGFCGVSKVGSKSRRCYHLCGHDPRTPTVTTKK